MKNYERQVVLSYLEAVEREAAQETTPTRRPSGRFQGPRPTTDRRPAA